MILFFLVRHFWLVGWLCSVSALVRLFISEGISWATLWLQVTNPLKVIITSNNYSSPKDLYVHNFMVLNNISNFITILCLAKSHHDIWAKELDCWLKVSSNSSCTITFTFGQMPLRKEWTPLSPPRNGLNNISDILLHLAICKQMICTKLDFCLFVCLGFMAYQPL